MEYLFIINETEVFNGQCLNTMPLVPQDKVNETKVHYSDLTFVEYNKSKGNTLKALTWEEYSKLNIPYLISLQKPFKETTEEHFNDALNCLPPLRWTRAGYSQFFFISECYTANLYSCFVKKDNKYFCALRAINTPVDDILNLKDVY